MVSNGGLESKYEPTKRRNYKCERDTWEKLWKERPGSACFRSKGIKDILKAGEISKKVLRESNLILDEVATKTILRYDNIKDKELKRQVLLKMKEIIQSEHDPWTESVLDHKGFTYPMLLGIIKWCRTGKKPDRLEKKITIDYGGSLLNFNEEEKELLKIMKDGGLDLCHKRLWADKATKILSLYQNKLKGEA